MSNGILDGISQSATSKFGKEFSSLLRVALEIDKRYAKSDISIDSSIKKFERLVFEFNNKYSLKLKIKKSVESFHLRVFAKEHSIKDFFANCASKVPGLKAIGRTNFGQADVSDMDNFSKMLDSIHDRVYVSYSENANGSFIAIFDSRENMVEISFDSASSLNEQSPVFQILAYYSLKDGVKSEHDIYSESLTFGFENILNEVENREFYDKVGSHAYDSFKHHPN